MSENSKDAIAAELAKGLGVEAEPAADDSVANDFFSRVEAELSKPNEPSEHEGGDADDDADDGKFVHEPTGKKFDSEVEYLRYDSSYNNDKWGKKAKELEEKFEALQAAKSEENRPNDSAPKTRDDIKKMLFPNQNEEVLKDPALDIMIEGLDNALAIYGQQQQGKIEALSKQVETLVGQLQETEARTAAGVSREQEQRLVEEHPWLRAIPDAQNRMAAMKSLASQLEARESGSSKLMSKASRLKAEDHVESSVSNSAPEDPEGVFEKRFTEASAKDRISILGQMFEKNDEIRSFLSGDV